MTMTEKGTEVEFMQRLMRFMGNGTEIDGPNYSRHGDLPSQLARSINALYSGLNDVFSALITNFMK